ncbi:MAG: ROK family protein [Dehalococcoidia bacterium]|nr:ROK family protein [Dehalococcoidia bacterium]
MSRIVVAADFGGTNLRSALVDANGEIVDRLDVRTPASAAPAVILSDIVKLFRAISARSPVPPVGAALGVPGLIDADAGKVIIAPNVAGFRNLVLTEPIAAELGIPVFIENDASAAALGEHRFGAGRGTRNLLHATLGTGIGGGIVVEGRLYRGAKGLAGEIGHIIIDPAGPRCNCGSRGCLESMVSGVAFAERARRIIASGASPVLLEIVGYREPTAADLHAAAKAGDRQCEAEIRHGGHLLGLGLGSLVNVLNPEAITLSGGLLAMGDMLLAPMKESMFSIAYGPASGTLVRLSTLGDEAGLLGAAAVAFERVESVAPQA